MYIFVYRVAFPCFCFMLYRLYHVDSRSLYARLCFCFVLLFFFRSRMSWRKIRNGNYFLIYLPKTKNKNMVNHTNIRCYTHAPSAPTGIIVVPCIHLSIDSSRTTNILFKNLRYLPEIWWDGAWYHVSWALLKRPCSVTFLTFHRTSNFSMVRLGAGPRAMLSL